MSETTIETNLPHIDALEKYERLLQAERRRLLDSINLGQPVGPLIDQLATTNARLAAIAELLEAR